jgi:biotin carboxyl carrier protein
MDDLLKLELPDGLAAVTIEVEADGFAVSVSRQAQSARAVRAAEPRAEAPAEKTQRVHATTVGVFSIAREWSAGDAVARGDVLGGIQSLGHVAEISAPADGEIREVDRPSSSLPSADRIAVSLRESGDGHVAAVTVESRVTTRHAVRVSRAERERYGGGDVADLVKRSFEFLLAREGNTSILGEFDLSTIERYFPEYAREFGRS